jgi:hypothetical protein
MRLPIASELIEIENFDYADFKKNLTSILEELIQSIGTKEAAIERAVQSRNEVLIPLIDSEYTGIVRFDCLWNPETNKVSILEINCDYPDGLLLHDKTYSALSGKDSTVHKDLLNQLFETDERVQVLHSPEAFFLDGYQAESDNFDQQGNGGSIISDTSNLPPDTTIRRCLETSKLTAKNIEDFTKVTTRLVNSVALRTLGYKDLLDSINHPYIPKTTRITPDVVQYCIDEQAHIVLKPTDGCEGHGIYFGNEIEKSDWAQLLTDVIDKNYIAQKLVRIPKKNVRLYDKGTIIEKTLYYDLCPHFFIKKGKIIGTGYTLMRFSEKRIVNVNQGGGIGYYRL